MAMFSLLCFKEQTHVQETPRDVQAWGGRPAYMTLASTLDEGANGLEFSGY